MTQLSSFRRTKNIQKLDSVFPTEGISSSEHIGKIIHNVRRVSRVSQEQLAKVLETEQSAISRIEAGSKNLSLYELHKICNFFNIRADEVLKDQVDYWQLSEKFGTKAPYPTRYISQPFIRYRKIAPLLEAIRIMHSEGLVQEILEELGFEKFLVRNPHQKIGTWFEFDFLERLVARKVPVREVMPTWIDLCYSERFMGVIYPFFNSTKNNKDLLLQWYLHTEDFESNFKYQFNAKGDSEVHLEAIPNEEFDRQLFKKHPLGHLDCSFRKGMIAGLPSFSGAGIQKMVVEETSCYFKGAESCNYQIVI